MKKVGQFFFALIPSLLVLGMQFVASFFTIGVSMLVEGTWYSITDAGNIFEILDDLSYFWMTDQFNTYIMVIYAITTITVFGLWYYMKYDGNYLPKIRTTFHPMSIIGVVMLMPGMQYLSTYIVALTATLFPSALEVYEDLLDSAGFDTTVTLGLFLYSVILAPLSEELIFRGVTLRQLKKCLPFWVANIVQGVLFGIFHMNLIQGVYACCLGLILGYICEKGGSIYYSIMLHMLFNFWGTVLSEYFTTGDSDFAILFWFLFAIVMTVAGLLVFSGGIRRLRSTADTTVSTEQSA